MKVNLLLILVWVGSFIGVPLQAQEAVEHGKIQASPEAASVIFLVRHAEKRSGEDPGLTAQGQKRAKRLAAMLGSANISHIHTSDYKRTQQTARPTSRALSVPIQIYDARDLATLARAILKAGDRHLVVGHSNTIPRTVALLGGEPGAAIDEHEYDRLYQITIVPGQAAVTVMRRY